jgi:magnesium chelatase family protein
MGASAAAVIFITSMNPCPCGFHIDPRKSALVRCRWSTVTERKKAGPVLDRIDFRVEVSRVPSEKLNDNYTGQPSKMVWKRMETTHTIQRERFIWHENNKGSAFEILGKLCHALDC